MSIVRALINLLILCINATNNVKMEHNFEKHRRRECNIHREKPADEFGFLERLQEVIPIAV